MRCKKPKLNPIKGIKSERMVPGNNERRRIPKTKVKDKTVNIKGDTSK
jgi:hypothetical protein